MQDQEWSFVDKSGWGDGPWQSESDKLQWTDPATGLPCLIVRNDGGALCGYCGVSEGHPWFGSDYSADELDASLGLVIDVHGGLTFAGHCQEGNKEHGICHVVEPGEPDRVWWFGFDCAHSGDLCPAYAVMVSPLRSVFRRPPSTYRDLAYVRAEVTSLAVQLHKAGER